MKSRFFRPVCLILALLLLLMAGCAPKENTSEVKSFLPEFDTYYPYLGWHKASILEDLGIQQSEFSEIDRNLYDISKVVEYQGIPFHIFLSTDSDCNWLQGFRYNARFDSDNADAAEKVFSLAQTLTTELGTPYNSNSNLLEMGIADFEAWFAAGETSGISVAWELGQLKTDSALAFRAFLEGANAYTEARRFYDEYPILYLSFTVYTNGTDTVKIELSYKLDCA